MTHVDHAPWPYAELDVAAVRAGGWRPTPFRTFVLKVHQRCNLACDYCYVYTQADQSWRTRPVRMSPEVRAAAVRRIAEHVRAHDLPDIRVILHGGEPLLYGADDLAALATEIRAGVPADVEIGMQTNGVRLDEALLDALRPHRIRIGVSLDGGESDNDRHRSTVDGRGSYAAAASALDLLRRSENRPLYAGLLCVVDPDTDPIATYERLVAFDPPAVDLLLPHANWTSPPAAGAYAEWLIAVFDHWYAASVTPRIRLFEDAMRLLLGGWATGEQLGLSPAATCVIETDGAIEQVDALKTAYEGAASTGLDVHHDPLDRALDHPGVVARQLGAAALAGTCAECRFRAVCGGGHYAHRFRDGTGFRNPSVYCADLLRFLTHVHRRLESELRDKRPADRVRTGS